MTVTAGRTAVTVNLLAGCTAEHCLQMAGGLKGQLDPKYAHGAAVLNLPTYEPRRTARKRAGYASRLGYKFGAINRDAWEDDIHTINTSATERQGRPMTGGYLERPRYGPNPIVCERHHVYTYGVVRKGHLVAYLWLYRSGQLALVSSILGHAGHLRNRVMYLLFWGMAERQQPLGGTCMYNLWDSGTEGLRFFKTRLGFERGNISWALS